MFLTTAFAFAKKLLGNVAKGLLKNSGLGKLLAGAFTQRAVNSSLTGKEREQNEFNASQADLQRQFAREEREQSQIFNADQAQKQMDFQEHMASTQYQRSIADMQAAGVNPAMAFGGIQGASASGAMATSSPASGAAASGSSQLQGLSEILEFARQEAEIERIKADIEYTRENTRGQKIGNDIQDEYGRSISRATLNELRSRASLYAAEADNEKERKGLIALEKTLKELETDPNSFKNFELMWRNQYIRDFNATPDSGAFTQLLEATFGGMRETVNMILNWQKPVYLPRERSGGYSRGYSGGGVGGGVR